MEEYSELNKVSHIQNKQSATYRVVNVQVSDISTVLGERGHLIRPSKQYQALVN